MCVVERCSRLSRREPAGGMVSPTYIEQGRPEARPVKAAPMRFRPLAAPTLRDELGLCLSQGRTVGLRPPISRISLGVQASPQPFVLPSSRRTTAFSMDRISWSPCPGGITQRNWARNFRIPKSAFKLSAFVNNY